MKLTSGEKLILTMLADIHEAMKIRGEIDPHLLKSAIWGGHTWALSWEYSGLSASDESDEVVKETADIMTMWRVIDNVVDQLSSGEREKLKSECYPYSITFEGFDGNHDSHMGVLRFMVEHLRRFEERKDGPFNSHSQMSLPHYKAMLRRYNALLDERNLRNFTVEDVRSILKGD